MKVRELYEQSGLMLDFFGDKKGAVDTASLLPFWGSAGLHSRGQGLVASAYQRAVSNCNLTFGLAHVC